MAAKRNSDWIRKAMGKPGALHEELGVPLGQKLTPADLKRAEAAGGKEAAQARLARTLGKFHHGPPPNPHKRAAEVVKAVKRNRKKRKRG